MTASVEENLNLGEVAKPVSPQAITAFVRAADMLVIALPGAILWYFYVFPKAGQLDLHYINSVIVAMILSCIVFELFKVYDEHRIFARTPTVFRTGLIWFLVAGLLLLLAFMLKISGQYSRVWGISWFLCVFGMLCGNRALLSLFMPRLARTGRIAQRTVIVGAGENGRRLAAHLLEHGDNLIRVVGFIDDRKSRIASNLEGLPVLGTTDDLIDMVRDDRVDQVLIALPWSAERRLNEVVHKLAVLPVHIRLATDLAGYNYKGKTISNLGGLPLLHIFDRPISGWSYALKTVEDRVLSFFILLFISPLFIFVATAIKLDSRGPVFFKQKRYGLNNKLIDVYKFRTMHHNLTDQNAERLTTRNDPRVTRVGNLLRRTSVDELPQLINVLKGEMSLVGPRPHAISAKAAGRLYQDVVERYAARHRVKPGITGWAQVNGWRGETDTEEKIHKRVEYDLDYIANWSIWLDLKILFMTVTAVIADDNAY